MLVLWLGFVLWLGLGLGLGLCFMITGYWLSLMVRVRVSVRF